MAVDLADLIPSLEREVSPPGTDLFPEATDDEWLGNLQDAFWEAKLFGFFDDYTEADGAVTPIDPSDPDMSRNDQQLIVLFAAARIVRNELKNMNTKFRAKAGPVEFETENSAQLLRDILKDVQNKVDLILASLGDLSATTTTYIDSLVGRDDSVTFGETYWWKH